MFWRARPHDLKTPGLERPEIIPRTPFRLRAREDAEVVVPGTAPSTKRPPFRVPQWLARTANAESFVDPAVEKKSHRGWPGATQIIRSSQRPETAAHPLSTIDAYPREDALDTPPFSGMNTTHPPVTGNHVALPGVEGALVSYRELRTDIGCRFGSSTSRNTPPLDSFQFRAQAQAVAATPFPRQHSAKAPLLGAKRWQSTIQSNRDLVVRFNRMYASLTA
jgi:hypothetical protein